MSTTRAILETYLAGDLAQWLTTAGLGNTDATGALKEPIDATLRALGVAEADLAGSGTFDVSAFGATVIARYYGLRRVLSAIGTMVDTDLEGDGSRKDSQAVAALREEIKLAWSDAQPWITVDPAAPTIVRIRTPYLAPLDWVAGEA